jgi:hypothetical protein
MIIQSREMVNIWKNRLMPRNSIIVDGSYETVDIPLLQDKIFPLYWRWMSSMKVTKWAHRWDCDNFSEAFRVFACGYFYNSIESTADSIAIGIIHYNSNSREENGTQGPHAINVAINKVDGIITPIYIEPQACKIINLKEQEYQSIWTFYI